MRPLTARPPIPRALRGRVHVRAAMRPEARAALLAEAAIVVPAPGGSERFRLDALAAGCAPAEPPGVERQPEPRPPPWPASPTTTRCAGAKPRRRTAAETQSFGLVAEELESLYSGLARRRRTRRPDADPLADRVGRRRPPHAHELVARLLHPVADLLEHAQEEGLEAIAVTDHNVFGGALEGGSPADGGDLMVIPGEEVKTDGQGGDRPLPRRGDSAGACPSRTRSPRFASRKAWSTCRIPSTGCTRSGSATLHRHLPDIDVFEVYNARLLFEAYNDEALRFARWYGLLAGAGSDAHVIQGVGTGALRMRRFEGPEEFLLSLRTAEYCAAPSRSPTCSRSSGWPRSRRRSARGEVEAACRPCPPTRSSATSRKRSPRSTSSETSFLPVATRSTYPCWARDTRSATCSCSSGSRSRARSRKVSPSSAARARRC